jgi:cyclopropane fatty-acyl-phospholipid synthase-like methyltransferase
MANPLLRLLFNKAAHTSTDVEQYYEEWTDQYVEFGSVWQSLLTENVEDMIYYIAKTIGIKDGMKVLDAGCGVCGPAVILAGKYDIHIEAITNSDKQLKYALENIKKSNLKGTINVQKGDYHDLDRYYKQEEFDVVFFLESLHNSCNPKKVIQSARNVVKDGGIIYIKDPYRRAKTLSKWEINQIETVERQFFMKLRTVGEIIDILGECGFELAFCRKPEVEASCDANRKFLASKHPSLYLKKQEDSRIASGKIDFNKFLEIKAVKRY